MSDNQDLERQIIENLKIRKKESQNRNFQAFRDSVSRKFEAISSTVKKPYSYAREFIEGLKAEQAKEREFQDEEFFAYQDYISMFDEGKIGSRDLVVHKALNSERIIGYVETFHTDIGPFIVTNRSELIRIGESVSQNYRGFIPIDEHGNYRYVDIEKHSIFDRTSGGHKLIEDRYSGVIRERNGKFKKIAASCAYGDEYKSDNFISNEQIFSMAENYHDELQKAVPIKLENVREEKQSM